MICLLSNKHLDASIDTSILTMIQNLKSDMIVDVMGELDDNVKNCNIPSKESLENATKEIQWHGTLLLIMPIVKTNLYHLSMNKS